MLLPQFKLSQNQKYVTVSIKVPYIKVTACQFYIDSNSFKFYLKPYQLNLTFEQPLKAVDEPAKTLFYYEKHIIEVQLQKKVKGQFFENLNLLSNVISTQPHKKTKNKRVMVEVISQKGNVAKLDSQMKNKSAYSYGFCGNYYGVFTELKQQCTELFMFDPASVKKDDRYQLSRKIVLQAFDENAYMFDKISNFDEIDRILQGKWSIMLLERIKSLKKSPNIKQKFPILAKIPKKQTQVNPKAQESIVKQIISLCFSYVYEYACMEGKLNLQSPKIINMTSAVLSCQVTYENLSFNQLIYDCCRRCVTYSVFKHLQICQKVCQVISQVLCKDFIIQTLLQLRVYFEKSHPKSLLNKIYIDDYLWYVLNKSTIESLLPTLSKQFQKLSHGLDEDGLQLGLETEQMENNLMQSVKFENELENLLDLD